MEEQQHTISVLVANKFGALARIAGLFSGRGYNIESLTVNRTHDPELSRMTIVTTGNEAVLEQIEKQLGKLVDVESVDVISFHYIFHDVADVVAVFVECRVHDELSVVREHAFGML